MRRAWWLLSLGLGWVACVAGPPAQPASQDAGDPFEREAGATRPPTGPPLEAGVARAPVVRVIDASAADGGDGQAPKPVHPGALVITELMVDPRAVTDADGEWFEVYNPGPEAFGLKGCAIADGGEEAHAFDEPVRLAALSFTTFARSEAAGFSPDVVTAFSLKNGADVLELRCDGIVIDRVAYDKARGFPVAAGVAMALDPDRIDAADNDEGASWCLSRVAYSSDRGTPGGPNAACVEIQDGGS